MILYLSCTGNTLWVAKQLADRTGEKLVDVASVVPGSPLRLHGNECLGFCFPVHGWRPPMYFREFIRNSLCIEMFNGKRPYTFALCTCGDTIGETMLYFEQDLQSQGFMLDAKFDLRMPNTYVGLPFMNVDSKAVERQKLNDAPVEIKKIAEAINQRQKGDFTRLVGNWPRVNSRFLGSLFVKHVIGDKSFCVDKSNCMHCGKCVRCCPVKNIVMGVGGAPEWKHTGKCLSCFACYHHCPSHSITYGMMTRGKGQYTFKK